jgi:hypothetical protein
LAKEDALCSILFASLLNTERRTLKTLSNRTLLDFRTECWDNPSAAWVAEMVDARDLKSLGTWYRAGSIPALGTTEIKDLSFIAQVLFYAARV